MYGHIRLLLWGLASIAALLPAGEVRGQHTHCVALDVYVRSSDDGSADIQRLLESYIRQHPGISLTVHNLEGTESETARQRLNALAKHFHFDSSQLPVVYGCNRVIVDANADDQLAADLQQLMRIDVYTRSGCPRCAKAKQFLQRIESEYPAFQIRVRDIAQNQEARNDLERLVQRHRQAAASVPAFDVCDQLVVGFEETSTGGRIERILALWTYACRLPSRRSDQGKWEPISASSRRDSLRSGVVASNTLGVHLLPMLAASVEDDKPHPPDSDGEPLQPLPLPGSDMTASQPPSSGGNPRPSDAAQTDMIEVPLLGRLSATRLGLPLFTIAVGLVDGFNPCAMWVLLFLLSILVNLHDRWRILAVAGTFVIISGLAYFAFMAAWLNVFQLVGLLRPVQIVLALTAIAVGAIHIKDFFAFKQGLSLSIPESAKPGIYARVRRIVTAENLAGAVIGAVVLAVMVNVVELLCTAGLPALYTEILTMQQLPTWQNYAYLGLYNVAYMFDDTLMVALVVITLGRRKMQESHGRILKLISGSAILLLGLIMLFKPDWLV